MGAACCVSAKDRTIVNGPSGEHLQRHVRYSPSWSFRWENRGRVAGEDTQANCSRDGDDRNDKVKSKSGTTTFGTAFASDEDVAIPKNLVQVTESLSVSHPSPLKLSPSGSSVLTSPRSSQNQLLPPDLTPSRCNGHSPENQLLRHVPASQVAEYRSPTFSISEKPSSSLPPAWVNGSTRRSNGGSSDSWSIPVFSELMTTRRHRLSFDSENSGFSLQKISRSSGQNSGCFIDIQTCGVCTKVLTERSPWGWSSHKIISCNELAVVSVLACGHVYHAECLEYLTPEINKYDPACPVCTYGEKRAVQMSEKALKAKLDMKAKKRSGKHVLDSDLNSNIWFDHNKSGVDERGPKINSNTSMGGSLGYSFLKRHFSFSSKAGKLSPDNCNARRKGLFWARSSKD